MAPRAAGFTLLELLVVMALASGVMLALGAALRTMGQTEVRIDQRLARTDEFRVATNFLRSSLGRVSARKVIATPSAGNPAWLFSAEPTGIAWVGVMPARYGTGGRFFFRLTVEQLNGATVLAVRFIPWTDEAQFPDWSKADVRSLAAGVRSFAIRYQDIQPNPPIWTDKWTITDRFPDKISISLESENGPWPELVMPMRVLSASNPRNSGAVFGGT